MAADGRKHILAIGGGALMPRQTLPFQFEQAIRLSLRPASPVKHHTHGCAEPCDALRGEREVRRRRSKVARMIFVRPSSIIAALVAQSMRPHSP